MTLLKCTQHVETAILTAEGSEQVVHPFTVGRVYDVAEIFELPFHVMARNPGESTWPSPGDAMFAWHHEDVFEPTDDGTGPGGGGSTTVLGAIKPPGEPNTPAAEKKKGGGLWPFR